MKKILLLSALLIFACSSSDDSSDNDDNDLMEETFLERFDGVVWESQENGTRRVYFNSPPSTAIDVIDNGQYSGCELSIFGIEDEAEYLYELLENNFDNLRVKVTDLILNEYVIWNVTVSSNDNILTVDGNNVAIRTDLQLICQ